MVIAADDAPKGGGKSEGHIIVDLNVTLIALSTAIVFGRLYARFFMTNARGWDDILVMIAFPLVIAVSCIEIVMVGYGGGSHMWTLTEEQMNTWLSVLPINALLILLTGCFVRLSILAFLPRLCINGAYMKYVWAAAAVTICSALASFFAFLLACSPISTSFHIKLPDDLYCVASRTKRIVVTTHAVISACLDVFLFGLPIWIVHETMVFNPKAAKVILIFCFGFLAVAAGILKTCFLWTTDFAVDITYKAVRVCTWTVIELHIGLWCVSFPALQPLLRLIWQKLKSLRQLRPFSSTHLQSSKETSQRNDLSSQNGSLSGSSGRAVAILETDPTTMVCVGTVDINKGTRTKVDILLKVEEGVDLREPDEAKLKWGPV